METPTPPRISAALADILRDDLNVDLTRVNRDRIEHAHAGERKSRLIDHFGSGAVTLRVAWIRFLVNSGICFRKGYLFSLEGYRLFS